MWNTWTVTNFKIYRWPKLSESLLCHYPRKRLPLLWDLLGSCSGPPHASSSPILNLWFVKCFKCHSAYYKGGNFSEQWAKGPGYVSNPVLHFWACDLPGRWAGSVSRFLVYVDSHSPSLKAIPWEENKLLVKLCEILLLPKVPFSSSAAYHRPFSLL